MKLTINKLSFSLIVILIGLIGFSGLFTSSTSALSGSEFKAGRIIDDAVFYNNQSMSVQQIQEFLNSKVPVCDTNGTTLISYYYRDNPIRVGNSGDSWVTTSRAVYGDRYQSYWESLPANERNPIPPGSRTPFICVKNYSQNIPTITNGGSNLCKHSITGGVKSSAQIIYDVAQACEINPQVFLVLLQKEQTLITDNWPWARQLTIATGYGCPDTAACDSQYYGFFNQVYQSAKAFRRYEANPDSYNYKANRNNTIYYNPNLGGCGNSNVFIENQATASLYIYTPYQPNAAALNNLYDTGDSCSAYGNRNFWRMFNDWFGSTFALPTPPSLVGRITSVKQVAGKINVFIRGSDGRLWQKWYENGQWKSGWNYIDGPSFNSTDPSAIAFGDGHMDVFEVKDGQLRHNWYNADTVGWRGWGTLGRPEGLILGNVTAVSQKIGKINVFARGSDGRLWQKWYENGQWTPNWNYIDGPVTNYSTPSAISFGNGHMDVFDIKDGQLRHNWYNADSVGWRGWSSFGQPAGVQLVNVTAVSQKFGKINVFARGSDGRLWQKWYENGQWTPNWNYIDGPVTNYSTPSAISFGNGHMDVFDIKDGQLRHNWYNADSVGWRGWFAIE